MTMWELNDRKIKISRQTITVKDDKGKTRGVVRGVNSFKDCRTNLQLDIWKTIRRYGVDSDKVFYAEGKWWYIHDLKWDSDFNKYFKDDTNMVQKYEQRNWIAESLTETEGIHVIYCWIL